MNKEDTPKEKVESPELPLEEASIPLAEQVAVKVREKALAAGVGEVVTLSNDFKVTFHPISYNVIFEAQAEIEDPIPPRVPHPNDPENPDKYIENVHDPDYLSKLNKAERDRIAAIQETLYLFGMELVDPMPKDEKWLEKLIVNGRISRQAAEEAGEVQKELWYKRYIVATVEALQKLTTMTDVSEEGIQRARAAFKSDT